MNEIEMEHSVASVEKLTGSNCHGMETVQSKTT